MTQKQNNLDINQVVNFIYNAGYVSKGKWHMKSVSRDLGYLDFPQLIWMNELNNCLKFVSLFKALKTISHLAMEGKRIHQMLWQLRQKQGKDIKRRRKET